MELDLSNNIISAMDSQIFWNNQDLVKVNFSTKKIRLHASYPLILQQLNLNANPMESLSTKLFAPTPYLEELDISDCDLVSLWHDSSKQPRLGEFLKNLKVFNASNNDIKHIYNTDLIVRLVVIMKILYL
jgi:Leucine-rich repeat (LRR) protein